MKIFIMAFSDLVVKKYASFGFLHWYNSIQSILLTLVVNFCTFSDNKL